MPSTPDPIGGNELQAAGEGLNVWGAPKLNTVITNLAFMIAGRVTYACNGSYTPTTTNYVANEFRAFIHDVTGTGGAITMPARPFVKLFRNGSAGTITVSCGGASATIQTGRSALVWSDSTDCFRFWDSDAGGARLTNLGSPVASADAVTKAYADNLALSGMPGTFPGETGNEGRFIQVQSDGTGVQWDLGWITKTANFTADRGGRYGVNTTSGPVTVTLPTTCQDGDTFWFMDDGYNVGAAGWSLNNMVVDPNGLTIMGDPTNMDCQDDGAGFGLKYRAGDFRIVSV